MKPNTEKYAAFAKMHSDLQKEGLSKANVRLAVTEHFEGGKGKNKEQMSHGYRQLLSKLVREFPEYAFLKAFQWEKDNKKAAVPAQVEVKTKAFAESDKVEEQVEA